MTLVMRYTTISRHQFPPTTHCSPTRQAAAFDNLASYTPWSNITAESKYDLLLADLGTHMGDEDYDAGAFGYPSPACLAFGRPPGAHPLTT